MHIMARAQHVAVQCHARADRYYHFDPHRQVGWRHKRFDRARGEHGFETSRIEKLGVLFDCFALQKGSRTDNQDGIELL